MRLGVPVSPSFVYQGSLSSSKHDLGWEGEEEVEMQWSIVILSSSPGATSLMCVFESGSLGQILLGYSIISMSELTELVLGVVLGSPQLVVLGDVNIHAEAALSGVAQDFMTTMGGSQMVSAPTHFRPGLLFWGRCW